MACRPVHSHRRMTCRVVRLHRVIKVKSWAVRWISCGRAVRRAVACRAVNCGRSVTCGRAVHCGRAVNYEPLPAGSSVTCAGPVTGAGTSTWSCRAGKEIIVIVLFSGGLTILGDNCTSRLATYKCLVLSALSRLLSWWLGGDLRSGDNRDEADNRDLRSPDDWWWRWWEEEAEGQGLTWVERVSPSFNRHCWQRKWLLLLLRKWEQPGNLGWDSAEDDRSRDRSAILSTQVRLDKDVNKHDFTR